MTLHRAAVLRHQRVRPRAARHLRVVEDVVEHRAPLSWWRTVGVLALIGAGALAIAACAVVAWIAQRGGW